MSVLSDPESIQNGLSVPATMRAAVLFGPRDLRVVDRPVPTPAADEVLVRVAMCGACGTDTSITDHPFDSQPPYGEFTPGHEWTGTVVQRGSSVDEVAIGDRVAIHVHHGCGRCRNCLTGSYTACLNYGNTVKGHRATGFTANGGFAEYVIHNVSGVYKLPDLMSWEDAVLVSTAGTAVYGIDRAGGLVAGDSVVVIGPGPVGLMAAQVVKALGAAEVILVGTRKDRLDLGLELGVTSVINSRDADVDVVEEVRRRVGPLGPDLVIESSGHPDMPNQALHMVRRGGTVLFLAFYDESLSFDLGHANREEIRLVTSRGEGRVAVGRALALVANGSILGGRLVTHRFALADIEEGFETIRNRTGNPMKVVFTP
jgi:L-iditol 2-dehydrogenase